MQKLSELQITDEEFDLFWILTGTEKIEFMFEALEKGVSEAMAETLSRSLSKQDRLQNNIKASEDLAVGPHRLNISIMDDMITFNSDSIRVIRSFVRKFYRDGHILLSKKTLKKDPEIDIYRYFKAYKLIKLGMPICEN
jgi:hypothetical protein